MNRSDDCDGFMARWSRRKLQVHEPALPEPPEPPINADASSPLARGADARQPAPATPTGTTPITGPGATPTATAHAAPTPPPTLDDVAALQPLAPDFSRFVAHDVPAQVQHAALSKLFSDPHFNVMDGLDVYIEDYHHAKPIPTKVLQELLHRRSLGIFTDKERTQQAMAKATQAAGRDPVAAEGAGDAVADGYANAPHAQTAAQAQAADRSAPAGGAAYGSPPLGATRPAADPGPPPGEKGLA
jgi:hypothetical protein